MNSGQKLLTSLANSEQKLVDVVGYFEGFDDGNLEHVLCSIGFVFEKTAFYVVAQEDDSFTLHPSDRCIDQEWIPVSFIKRRPWSLAIGKPIFWSWTLYNQQGYFDGIQLVFADNSESRSIAIQLIALGSEIKQREVSEKIRAITFAE